MYRGDPPESRVAVGRSSLSRIVRKCSERSPFPLRSIVRKGKKSQRYDTEKPLRENEGTVLLASERTITGGREEKKGGARKKNPSIRGKGYVFWGEHVWNFIEERKKF